MVIAVLTIASGSMAFAQTAAQHADDVILTGIILVADHRCSATHSADMVCRSSDWALASGRTTYLLSGDIATLQKFERQRVTVKGVLQIEPIVITGQHAVRRKIAVQSVERNELSEAAMEALVQQLRTVPWQGPENHCSPMCWDFAFTEPMIGLLQAGSGTQDLLLRHINDSAIRDQVVMLLGGIGNEESIWPIIETLTDGEEATIDAKSKRLNLIGDLALTNLTVSEVIWHHGGGLSPNRCPDTPKSCWTHWWFDHRDSFKVGVGGDRLYSDYPNYGIYAQFSDSSIQ
jgi:hypothetical protein